jgi:hypothetical protein
MLCFYDFPIAKMTTCFTLLAFLPPPPPESSCVEKHPEKKLDGKDGGAGRSVLTVIRTKDEEERWTL